jgi:hypothetical protein
MLNKRLGFVLLVTLAAGRCETAFADDRSTFVITAASGYGVEDCLGEGGECGQVVADAWCEAHGRGAALKFGHSDAVAGDATPPGSRPYFITCGN